MRYIFKHVPVRRKTHTSASDALTVSTDEKDYQGTSFEDIEISADSFDEAIEIIRERYTWRPNGTELGICMIWSSLGMWLKYRDDKTGNLLETIEE